MMKLGQLEKDIEVLQTSNDELNEAKLKLSTEVGTFKEMDAMRKKTEFESKVQLLSKNYKKLGQEKSVLELSKLTMSTITELENVVGVALKSQDESVIVPSQAMNNDVPVKTGEEKVELSKLKNPSFFEHVCNELETQRIAGKAKINV